MTLLEKLQLERIQKLKARVLSLETETNKAKKLLEEMYNEMLHNIKVNEAEVVEPNLLDNYFQSPIEQLTDIFKNMY
jgi:phosphoribosylformylglycinamidine (FGAM) synthase PurS component